MSLALTLIALLTLVSIPLIAFITHVRHKKASGASFVLIGKCGRVEAALAPEGTVLVEGEAWRARSRKGLHLARGQEVRVCGTQGVLLVVELDDTGISERR
jgi:membrane protein implicated in regulation of membrane protease activity